MATKRVRGASAFAYFVVDLLAVFLFIFAGRETGGIGLRGELLEATPFFAGTAVGWAAGRVWRTPRVVRWSGVFVWVSTVVIGTALSAFLDEPVDSRFAIFAFVSLGLFLLGWRGLAWVLAALFGRMYPKVVDEKYRH